MSGIEIPKQPVKAEDLPSIVIDCDADPFIPEGFSVVEHKRGGQLEFDPKKIAFYHSIAQAEVGKFIMGNELRIELSGQSVLNANVLDYLLAHPNLIPEEWKKDDWGQQRYIFFWGTIYNEHSKYKNRDGVMVEKDTQYVRFLQYGNGKWYSGMHDLDYAFPHDRPAAVLAK